MIDILTAIYIYIYNSNINRIFIYNIKNAHELKLWIKINISLIEKNECVKNVKRIILNYSIVIIIIIVVHAEKKYIPLCMNRSYNNPNINNAFWMLMCNNNNNNNEAVFNLAWHDGRFYLYDEGSVLVLPLNNA